MQVTEVINDIETWMNANKLKLNKDKTEFLIIASPHSEQHIQVDHIRLDNDIVSRSPTVRAFDVLIDSALTMESHVNSVVRTCYYSLRWIRDAQIYTERKCF